MINTVVVIIPVLVLCSDGFFHTRLKSLIWGEMLNESSVWYCPISGFSHFTIWRLDVRLDYASRAGVVRFVWCSVFLLACRSSSGWQEKLKFILPAEQAVEKVVGVFPKKKKKKSSRQCTQNHLHVRMLLQKHVALTIFVNTSSFCCLKDSDDCLDCKKRGTLNILLRETFPCPPVTAIQVSKTCYIEIKPLQAQWSLGAI